MAEMTTTGTWLVDERKQTAFLEAWVAFAGWASSMDGAGTLRLGRAIQSSRSASPASSSTSTSSSRQSSRWWPPPATDALP